MFADSLIARISFAFFLWKKKKKKKSQADKLTIEPHYQLSLRDLYRKRLLIIKLKSFYLKCYYDQICNSSIQAILEHKQVVGIRRKIRHVDDTFTVLN